MTAWLYDPFRRWWSKRTSEAESELDVLFAKTIRANSRILELGPGTGVNLDRLYRVAPEFHSYLGIDFSREMLARAQRRAKGDSRVELRLGDVCDLSSLEGRFDFIFSTWVLSHLEQPEEAVRAAIEKLAPGGVAAFLFGTAPASGGDQAVYRAIWRAGSARRVDPEPLHRLPGFERAETFDASLGASATLIVYRAAATGA
ncbi:MAG: class I SAM-dependent methyltransferase [Myxococcota bacterium]